MMANTFDAIGDGTAAAIVFAKFQLAINLDEGSNLMPPPLNIVAMMLVILFYMVEYFCNYCKYSVWWIRRWYTGEEIKYIHFDLALLIMPPFLKKRQLEMDEQCIGKHFTILTSKGMLIAKVTGFDRPSQHHEIRFFKSVDDGDGNLVLEMENVRGEDGRIKLDEEGNNVQRPIKAKATFGHNILRKHIWEVDILQLASDGILDLDQFNDVVTAELTHRCMHDDRIWICNFCRSYATQSSVSLNRLARELNAEDLELRMLKRVQPEICPNCYRYRHDLARWRFVWELISLLLFYLFVWWMLFVSLGGILLLKLVIDPTALIEACTKVFYWVYDKWVESPFCSFCCCCNVEVDEHAHEKNILDSMNVSDDMAWCNVEHHYQSRELVHALHTLDNDNLFVRGRRSALWTGLQKTKRSIDPTLLMKAVAKYINDISYEDEITEYDFFDDYLHFEALQEELINVEMWETRFKPLAAAIYSTIHSNRKYELHLHLFGRLPFSARVITDELERWWDDNNEAIDANLRGVPVEKLQPAHIVVFLEKYQSLRCKNSEERQNIVYQICECEDDGKSDDAYYKFTSYLTDVAVMFTRSNLQTMLRDVTTTILERGTEQRIVLQEFDLVFADIPSDMISLPLFRCMKPNVDTIKLWTLRNFLQTVLMLDGFSSETLVNRTPFLVLSKEKLLSELLAKNSQRMADKEHQKTEKGNARRIKRTMQLSDWNANSSVGSGGSDDDASLDLEIKNEREVRSNLSSDAVQEEKYDDENDIRLRNHKLKFLKRKQEEHRHLLLHTNRVSASAIDKCLSFIFDQLFESRTLRPKITNSEILDYQKRLPFVFHRRDTLEFVYKQMCRYCMFNVDGRDRVLDVKTLEYILNMRVFSDQLVIDDQSRPNLGSSDVMHQALQEIFNRSVMEKDWGSVDKSTYVVVVEEVIKQDSTLGVVVEEMMKEEQLNAVVNEETDEQKSDAVPDVHEENDEKTSVETNDEPVTNLQEYTSVIVHDTKEQITTQMTMVVNEEVVDTFNYKPPSPKSKEMTVFDGFSIVLLLNRLFASSEAKLLKSSDTFVVTRSAFLKFVDPREFKHGMASYEWSSRAKAAANIFQSCLDEQQKKVTLGEIQQTAYEIRTQVCEMLCGSITRIKHFVAIEAERERNKYRNVRELEQYKAKLENYIRLPIGDRPESPSLKYDLITSSKWSEFVIRRMSAGYHPNMSKIQLPAVGNTDIFRKFVHTIDICTKDAMVGEDNKDNDEEAAAGDISVVVDNNTSYDMKKKCKRIFNMMIMKYEHRITLQQLIFYLRKFQSFLQANVRLSRLVLHYDPKDEYRLKNIAISKNFDEYYEEYWSVKCFGVDPREVNIKSMIDGCNREIRWLYGICFSEFDLVEKITPYIKGTVVEDFYDWMDGSIDIDGTHEVRSEEFAQFKHQLRVNAKAAMNLFHIIRARWQSLSWNQVQDFMVFLEHIIEEVDESVRKHPEGTDADLTVDRMRLLLHISSMDEARWFFDHVELCHADKLSWKHLRKYLKKTLDVRQEVRDFFDDMFDERDYDDNTAEKFMELNSAIESIGGKKDD